MPYCDNKAYICQWRECIDLTPGSLRVYYMETLKCCENVKMFIAITWDFLLLLQNDQ